MVNRTEQNEPDPESLGGTLVEEFQVVGPSPTCGPRRVDAIILPNAEKRRVPVGQRKSDRIEDQDVIVVQSKAKRLGMYLMGQAVFSAPLIKRFNPRSIRSVALCKKDDSVLHPLLNAFPHVEVVVMDGVGTEDGPDDDWRESAPACVR